MPYEAPQYKIADFDYDRPRRILTAYASDLHYNTVVPEICILSEYTGTLIRFARYKTDYDNSGEDVAGWRYRPTANACTVFPHLAGLEVLIIND